MNLANQQSFGERVTKLRKEAGLTQKQLADQLEVSLTSVQNYESGRIPNGEILVKLAAALNCSSEWLVTGTDALAKAALPDVEASLQANIYNGKGTLTCADCEVTMIPMVEARLSAGSGSWETSADADRHYAFRTDFLRRKGNTTAMVLMRVAGDSMDPEVKDNDVVLIDTSNTTPYPGRLYAVAIQELVYLKMVNATPDKLVLTSANPAYGPMEIDARGDLHNGIKIIGKAVWVGRELD